MKYFKKQLIVGLFSVVLLNMLFGCNQVQLNSPTGLKTNTQQVVDTNTDADAQAQQWIIERKRQGLDTCVPMPDEWRGSVRQPVPIPELTSLVVDDAQMLASQEKLKLTNYLLRFEKETSSQLAVLTIPSLNGEGMFSFAQRAACEYRLGRKLVGDGVLLIISKQDRKLWLYIFGDVEPYISNAQAQQIIEKRIKPSFKQEQFFDGIHNGMTEVMRLMRGHLPKP